MKQLNFKSSNDSQWDEGLSYSKSRDIQYKNVGLGKKFQI